MQFSSTGAAQQIKRPGGSYEQSQRIQMEGDPINARARGRYMKNKDEDNEEIVGNEDGFEQYYMMNETLGVDLKDNNFSQSPSRLEKQDRTAQFKLQETQNQIKMPSPGSYNIDSNRYSQKETLAQSKSVEKFDSENQGQFFSSNGYDMVKCNRCGRAFFSGKFQLHLKVCGKTKPHPNIGFSEDQSSRQEIIYKTEDSSMNRKMVSSYLKKVAQKGTSQYETMMQENPNKQVFPIKRQLVPAAIQSSKHYNNYANLYQPILNTLQVNNSSENITGLGHSQLRMGAISNMSGGGQQQQSVMPKWKREHLSFIKNIRQINQQQSPMKTLSQNRSESVGIRGSYKRDIMERELQTIDIPDDLVPCPHCQRKFSQSKYQNSQQNLEACDRHIAVCSTIKNRPRPPPTLASILNINSNKESKQNISEYRYNSQSWSRARVNNNYNVSTSQNYRRNNLIENRSSSKPIKVQSRIKLTLDKSPRSSNLYSNNSSLSNNVRGSLQMQKSRVSFIPSNSVHKKSLEIQKNNEETPDRGGTFFLSAVDQSFQSQSKSVLQKHSKEYSQQVFCHLCKKNFSRKAGERHIPVCAQIMNKPSRLVRDRSRQSVGIQIDTNRDSISVRYRSNNVSVLSNSKRDHHKINNSPSPDSRSPSLSAVRKPSVPVNRSALFRAQVESLKLQPSTTSNNKTKISTLNSSLLSTSNNTQQQQGRNYQTIINQINRHKIQTDNSQASPYSNNNNGYRNRLGVVIGTNQSFINKNKMQNAVNQSQSRQLTSRKYMNNPSTGRLSTMPQSQTISEDPQETQRYARKIAQGMVYRSIQQQITKQTCCNQCRKVMRPSDVFCSKCGVKRTFKLQPTSRLVDQGGIKKTVNSAIFIQENNGGGGQATATVSSNQQSQSVLSSSVIK